MGRTVSIFYKPGARDEAMLVMSEAVKLGYRVNMVEDSERDAPLAIVTPFGVFREPWQAVSVLRHGVGDSDARARD